jgi:uncharacterized protein YdhG (YjbR/CyaY superfamily)
MTLRVAPNPEIDGYLANLESTRRDALSAVREVILENLPSGYQESMTWSMPTYEVPLSIKPDTYNKKPLLYAAFASQKNYMSLYLSAVYANPRTLAWFTTEYRASGKRLDMGKSCVRFKSIDDLPLELIAETIAMFGTADFIDMYDHARSSPKGNCG